MEWAGCTSVHIFLARLVPRLGHVTGVLPTHVELDINTGRTFEDAELHVVLLSLPQIIKRRQMLKRKIALFL